MVSNYSKLASNLNTQAALSAGSGRQLLTDIQTTLDAIAALLVPPDYNWLTSAPKSPPFAATLDRLQPVEVVRRDFIDSLRASGLKAEADTRSWLLRDTIFDNTPVLTATDSTVALSAPMEATRRLLNDLFSQPFMQPTSAPDQVMLALPDSKIGWDIKTLGEAEAIAESFLAFAPKDVERAPQALEQQVRWVAGTELLQISPDW
jgi:hypothetical protein